MSARGGARSGALRFDVPAGACDSHIHFYGPRDRYPIIGHAPYVVPDGLPDDFFALQAQVGLERAVVVNTPATGRDNRRTLDALGEHPRRLRGILTPQATPVTDAQLRQWDDLGARGFRFSYVGARRPDMEIDEALAARIEPLGWHAQVHVEHDQIVGIAELVLRLPCPVVIDHFARIPAASRVDGPAFQCLLRLVDSGRVWVKLSAPMRISGEPGPPYGDVLPFARALVARAPQRMLWASDWPNVNFGGVVPPYRDLLDLLADWAPDAADRRRILVDNPATLYRF